MNKGKKNKRNLLLIVYSLCALAAFMAEIYFMVNYRKEYVIIVAIGLVFLTSVGFLMEEIFDNAENKLEYKSDDNNLEDLLKVQKAVYVQGKNLTEEISRLFEEGIDSITQAIANSTKDIIDNEKNIAKVIIKKNDDSNDKIRVAVEEIDLSKIPIPEIKMPEIKIPEIPIPEIKMPDMPLQVGGNSNEIELAKNEIISLIEKLSEQVQNSAKLDDIVELKEMLSKGLEKVNTDNVVELVEEEPMVEEISVEEEPMVEENSTVDDDFDINAENTFEDLFKNLADEIAEETSAMEIPVIEEMSVKEMPLIMDEIPVEEPVVEESEAEVDVEEQVIEEPVIEELVIEEPVIEESASEIAIPDMGDDPNKQMSADEIAALFASIQ